MLQLSFVSFKKDSYILVEGKIKTDCFYIIQSGNVKIMHEIEIPGRKPEILGPGDFLGVVSCMSGQANVESAFTLSDVVCIAVQKSQFPDLIQKNIPVALKIIRSFAKKMRETNQVIMLQTASKVAEDNPNQIYRVAEYYDTDYQMDVALFAYYQYMKVVKKGPFFEQSKIRFSKLRKNSNAVYLEPSEDTIRKYPKGTMIFSEAQNGSEMYIIQQGAVKISKIVKESDRDNGQEVIFTILKKGDLFGEMALIENKPRSACAIAVEDCVLMAVNNKNFNQMVSSQPEMVARLTMTFANRLWPMYRQLINSIIEDPLAKMIDMLQLQLEKNKIKPDENPSFRTNYTPTDVAQMCGLSKTDQAKVMYKFLSHPIIHVEDNKIIIPKVDELYKQSVFYRKALARKINNK